ncbi:AAEL000586-PA [Aedes aegypti]|uniref:AAEL000586-PA n=1 Tax=Aedes aegypti TaxID=7159 RepID=Q17NV0_AEDAE|nr:AAEL000586-PA [Aedes aegypti]
MRCVKFRCFHRAGSQRRTTEPFVARVLPELLPVDLTTSCWGLVNGKYLGNILGFN